MGGLARGGDVVERRALVEERGLRRIQVFRRDVLLQRAAAEGDNAAAQVGDREHHAVAEAIERQRDIVAGNQEPGLHHVLDRNAVAAEMLLEREALIGRVAEAEFHLRRGIEAAVGEIAARLGAGAAGERRFEILRRQFHDVVQRLAPRVALLVFLRDFRQRHAGHLRQALDRLGELNAFGLHDKAENVAVLAGGEIVEEALLVVDRERGRLLLVEGRQADEFAALLAQLHAPADHLRYRKAGAQLIEELRREAHASWRVLALVRMDRFGRIGRPIIGRQNGTSGATGEATAEPRKSGRFARYSQAPWHPSYLTGLRYVCIYR